MAFFRGNWLLHGEPSRWLRRNRAAVVFAMAATVIASTHLASVMGFIPLLKLEQALIDFRFRLRENVPASSDCVIIGINASSLDPSNFSPTDLAGSEALRLMQQPFPWNRKVYAMLLDRLIAAGARTVVFDLLFLNDAGGDEDLATALTKYGDRVVIGSAFAQENPDSTDARETYRVSASRLLSATRENMTGCTTLPIELDGVIRRTWYRTSELRQYGLADDSRNIISMAGLGAAKFNPQLVLPDGVHFINFQGPATTYRYLPIEEVFMDRIFSRSRQFEFGKVFRNKLVFVGPVAEIFHDSHSTPYGLMPGVEIHAQIAASLLQGTLLRNAPAWLALALSGLMGLAAATVSLRMAHALALGGFLVGGIVVFMGAAQWAFVQGGMLIPMATPSVVFAGIGLFGLIFKFLLEQMERTRIRSVLDRYVSRNVAELVLAEGDEFEKAIRGQRRCVTTLFSDIRGFTTMTEGTVVAENLVEQMNEYFFKMVEAVVTAEGTLQQFIGDAIMAVWGNTHTLEPAVGALKAVQTSLAMEAALAELNATWSANPLRLQFRTGIGVNHGEVIVGSLGHPQRMEFTVIGDGINTAARLETATKQFGCAILVGESVENLTRGKFHYRQIGLVRFKGKTKAIEVFTPLAESGTAPPPWLDPYHQAIDLYKRRQFKEAQSLFEGVAVQVGAGDRLCEMYLTRCKAFLSDPPAADWDTAWTLTEK
jgi:adenylate cyclase